MKFETITLHSVFIGCLLLCVLTMGAMLTAHPHSAPFVAAHSAAATMVRSAS